VGDYVLVHAGFAIAVIDAVEAARTLAYHEEFAAEEGP
jgi:hydrogenase expression/formation protein HypC